MLADADRSAPLDFLFFFRFFSIFLCLQVYMPLCEETGFTPSEKCKGQRI